jgi:hypothetical protein
VALGLHSVDDVRDEILDSTRKSTPTPAADRRRGPRTDRRKHSRSGRRDGDPRFNWRRIAWLFAGYALLLSARSLPSTVKRKFFNRSTPIPS